MISFEPMTSDLDARPAPTADIERLFGSVDVETTPASAPLATADIAHMDRGGSARAHQAMERIRATMDLLIDRIEPYCTGDFSRSKDLAPPPRDREAESEELMVVGH